MEDRIKKYNVVVGILKIKTNFDPLSLTVYPPIYAK
jgi:hypothetical protein